MDSVFPLKRLTFLMFTRKVNTTAVSLGFFSPSNEFLGHLARENGNIAYCKSHNDIISSRRAYYNKNRRVIARRFSLGVKPNC